MKLSSKMILILIIGMNLFPLHASEKLADFYKEIDKAIFEKNLTSLLQLLSKLDSCEEIKFGNGFGPVDKNTLQVSLIGVIEKTFGSNEKIAIQENVKAQNNVKVEEWLTLITLSADDNKAILKLLQSDKVAVKYLGILKARYSSNNPEIIKELENIAEKDPYIVIAGGKKETKIKTNNLPNNGIVDASESVFIAPLREEAKRVLNIMGKDFHIDQDKITIDGIIMLVKLYKNASPILKEEILEAVSLFSPGSRAYNMLLKNDISNEYIETIKLFRSKLLRKI